MGNNWKGLVADNAEIRSILQGLHQTVGEMGQVVFNLSQEMKLLQEGFKALYKEMRPEHFGADGKMNLEAIRADEEAKKKAIEDAKPRIIRTGGSLTLR
jgi:hypothetical protein